MCYYDEKSLYFEFSGEWQAADVFSVAIEPCRLWPAQKFSYSMECGGRQHNYLVSASEKWSVSSDNNFLRFVIPFDIFEGYYKHGRAMRFNISVNDQHWVKRHPLAARLHFGTDNPEDYGWLFFSGKKTEGEDER
jgi:hypothetical protein